MGLAARAIRPSCPIPIGRAEKTAPLLECACIVAIIYSLFVVMLMEQPSRRLTLLARVDAELTECMP